MAIYFDGVHLATDGDIEELHWFATIILGMDRDWFQDHPLHPHYDVWGRRVARVVKNGGILVTSKELVLKCYASKFKQLQLDFQKRLEDGSIVASGTFAEDE